VHPIKAERGNITQCHTFFGACEFDAGAVLLGRRANINQSEKKRDGEHLARWWLLYESGCRLKAVSASCLPIFVACEIWPW
jgi:hypothetical protein